MGGRAAINRPVSGCAENTTCDAAHADRDQADLAVFPKSEADAEFEGCLTARALHFSKFGPVPAVCAIGDEGGASARCTGPSRAALVVIDFESEDLPAALAPRLSDWTDWVTVSCGLAQVGGKILELGAGP